MRLDRERDRPQERAAPVLPGGGGRGQVLLGQLVVRGSASTGLNEIVKALDVVQNDRVRITIRGKRGLVLQLMETGPRPRGLRTGRCVTCPGAAPAWWARAWATCSIWTIGRVARLPVACQSR